MKFKDIVTGNILEPHNDFVIAQMTKSDRYKEIKEEVKEEVKTAIVEEVTEEAIEAPKKKTKKK